MRISDYCIGKIKEFEGCRLTAYKDAVGVPTIGVGHTRGVKMGQTITMGQADSLLRADIRPCETYVNGLLLTLTQSQFDSLVDFCFNLGIGALRTSTLLRYIKEKRSVGEIQAQFRRWNKAGGKVLNGLVKRREWEAQMWAK